MEMEADRTSVNLTGGNVSGGNISDVPISFPEPLENGLQVQSSAEVGDEKEGGNVSNDRIKALNLEVETLRLECSDLERKLASSTADLEDKLSRMQQALIVKSSEAENALAEADMTRKMLTDRATSLMEDLNMAKEKARIALMEKEEEINALNEALSKCKEEVEVEKEKRIAMEPSLEEKENEIMSLQKDLQHAKEYQELENNRLEEKLKGLKDDVSKLEAQTKKNLSRDRDGGFLQNNRGMELKKVEDGRKFSWATAAALMASTGTVAAVIAAFYLRHKKQG